MIDPSDSEPSPFFGDDSEVALAIETAQARPKVEREAPIPSSELFGASAAKGMLARCHLVGVDDPENQIHPFGGMCKVCEMKEPPVKTKLDVLWRQIDPKLAPGWFAVNCCEECYAAAKVDTARLTANREFWEKVCPIEFRKDWDARKGDAAFLAKVMAYDIRLKRGLMLHGPSDSGKTRAVWHLLRKLAEDGVSWCFIESIDLIDDIPKEAFTCQLLVIDDLGNDHLSGPKEVRLLKLIRTRCSWHRPFIVTTQFNGDALRKKFSEGATASAVIRRLREYCDGIEARQKF